MKLRAFLLVSWVLGTMAFGFAHALDAIERVYNRNISRVMPTRAPRWVWLARGRCFGWGNKAACRRVEWRNEARSRRLRSAAICIG